MNLEQEERIILLQERKLELKEKELKLEREKLEIFKLKKELGLMVPPEIISEIRNYFGNKV